MITKTILSSGATLPTIGLGTYKSFDVPLNQLGKLKQVIEIFLLAGGKLFDSSPMYGRAEAVIGKILKNHPERRNCFIATKVWTTGRKQGMIKMNDSIDKIGFDKIDLMQVHNLIDAETHLETLRGWKAEKKIKYIGITHYSDVYFGELKKYLSNFPDIDFCQIPYSIGRREAEKYLLDMCLDLNVATLINRPFEQNDLFKIVDRHSLPEWAAELGCSTWAQFFLKYILGHKGATCVIPATSKPEHMLDNLAAGKGRLPDKQELLRMADYFDNL